MASTTTTIPITENVAKEALNLTQKIIDKCGPRLTGTPSCLESAHLIATELKPICDKVVEEEFTTHLNGFLGFFKIYALTYLIGTICLFFSLPGLIIATCIYLLGILWAISQFVFYKEIFDVFYKKVKGINVYGTIEPAGEVKQQIIFGGHHDTVQEFTYIFKHQKLYSIRIIVGIASQIVVFVLTTIWLIYQAATGDTIFYATALQIVAIILLIPVENLFFFVGENNVPGAGDNLIATTMVIELAKIFGNMKKAGNYPIQNTRLVFMSVDAEEQALRGSRAYCKQHKAELQSIPTYAVMVDSVYNLNSLQATTSNINGTIKDSEKIAKDLQTVGSELGYKVALFPMAFGGGGTDSASFGEIGVEASTILALPTTYIRDNLVYHTRNDKVEFIEPAAVEACMKIMYQYAMKKDKIK